MEIRYNINFKTASRSTLMTGEILPDKTIIKVTYLINALFRLQLVSGLQKVAEVMM